MDISNKRFIEVIDYLINKGRVNGPKDLSEKIGVSPSMISDIKSGRSKIGLKTLSGIADRFPEINIRYILVENELKMTAIEGQCDDVINELSDEINRLREELSRFKRDLKIINRISGRY